MVTLILTPTTPMPSIVQSYTHTQIGGCETSEWPDPPGEGNLLLGYFCPRGGNFGDPDLVVPIGTHADPGTCGDQITGTEWTFVDSFDTTGVYAAAGILARRDSEASEPQRIKWAPIPPSGGLAGNARPRVHQVEVHGPSGAPTVESTSTEYPAPGAVFTSHDLTVPSAGIIFVGMSYWCTGPSDGSSPSFTMTPRGDAVILTQGFCDDFYGGYSTFGYLSVSGPGTYNVVYDRSAKPRSDPVEESVGWIMAFWPG